MRNIKTGAMAALIAAAVLLSGCGGNENPSKKSGTRNPQSGSTGTAQGGSLRSINIPQGMTEIGMNVFINCVGVTSLTIPYGVTEIGFQSFGGCSGLKSVSIPDSVTRIGGLVFYKCENVKITYKGKTYDYEHIEELEAAINGE